MGLSTFPNTGMKKFPTLCCPLDFFGFTDFMESKSIVFEIGNSSDERETRKMPSAIGKVESPIQPNYKV
jgi:hypothetical protein